MSDKADSAWGAKIMAASLEAAATSFEASTRGIVTKLRQRRLDILGELLAIDEALERSKADLEKAQHDRRVAEVLGQHATARTTFETVFEAIRRVGDSVAIADAHRKSE